MRIFSPQALHYPNRNFFYPNDNMQAKSLLVPIPRHIGGIHFLLLGCGDLRNVLFTLWHLKSENSQGSKRKLDFTLCDWEAAIHARNIILLVLATDAKFAKERTRSDYMHQLWRIYYYQFIDSDCYDLILRSVSYILSFCDNWDFWHQSHIGKYIYMTSESTFICIRKIWQAYKNTKFNTSDLKNQRGALYSFYSGFKATFVSSTRNTGLAPEQSELSIHDGLLQKYFKDGVYSEPEGKRFSMVNPLFAVTQWNGTDFAVHYETNPILGYCLVSACREALNTPFAVNYGLDLEKRLVEVCKMQFEEWLLATCDAIENSQIVLRIYCGDALECCLQLSELEDGCRSFLQWKLPSVKNSITRDTPRQFDVIDTSNLSDSVGLLNLLVHTESLLKDHTCATLYTDMLIHHEVEKGRKAVIEKKLYMSLESAAVILGLSLAEENLPIRFGSRQAKENSFINMPMFRRHLQLSWHRTIHFDTDFSRVENPEFSLAPLSIERFTEFFTEVFAKIHEHRDLQHLLFSLSLRDDDENDSWQCQTTTCQGFVRLLEKYLSRFDKKNDELLEELYASLALISDRIIVVKDLQQEFFLWLHLLGIYTCESLKRSPMSVVKDYFPRTYDLPQLIPLPKPYPSVSLLCLVVPRKLTMDYLGIPGYGSISKEASEVLVSPPLACQIESPHVNNFFPSIHLSFGFVQKSGGSYKNKAYLCCSHFDIVEAEYLRDQHATLIMLVYVPTFILLANPKQCLISLFEDNFRPYYGPAEKLMKIGIEKKIFTTNLADTKHVSIALNPPLLSRVEKRKPVIVKKDSEVVLANECNFEASGVVSVQWTMNSENTSNLKAILEKSKSEISQKSTFSLDLKLISTENSKLVLLKRRIMMPFMVNVKRSSVEIFKENCYVTVTAKPGYPASLIPPENIFPRFFKSLESNSFCLPFSNLLPSISLDTCIALNTTKDLEWLKAAISHGMLFKDSADRSVEFLEGTWPIFIMCLSIISGALNFIEDNYTNLRKPLFIILGAEIIVHINAFYYETTLDNIVLDSCISIVDPNNCMALLSFLSSDKIRLIKRQSTTKELHFWHFFLTSMLGNDSKVLHGPSCKFRKCKKNLASNEQPKLYCQCALGKNLPASFCKEFPEVYEYFYSVPIPIFSGSFDTHSDAMSEAYKVFGNPKADNKHRCMQCKKEEPTDKKKKLLVCGKCKSARYCSKECQLKHWPTHKVTCQSK